MPNEPILKDGGPTNIYLPKELKERAKALAKERYKTSLSSMIQSLLVAEIKRKRGIAHLHPRQLEGAR